MKALFILEGLDGHLNPTAKLAHILRMEGYNCAFATNENLRSKILGWEFKFYPIYSSPFGMGLEEIDAAVKQLSWSEDFINRLSSYYLLKRRYELNEILNDFVPTHVFLDNFNSTDYLILPALHAKIFIVHTAIPNKRAPLRPPIISAIIPDPDKERLELRFEWFKLRITQGKNYIVEAIKYLGFTNKKLFVKLLLSKGVSTKQFKFYSNRDFQFNNLTNLILAPKAFDFRAELMDSNYKYCGMCIIENPLIVTPELRQALNLRSKQRKIVYCSLGSVSEYHNSNVDQFLSKVVAAFSDNNSYLLIVSGISKCIIGTSNVRVFYTVNQIEVLKRCDLFITHGGLNSIMEAIKLKVPMLICPLNKRWDHGGNAARAAVLGIAKIGNLATISSDDIVLKAEELLHSSDYQRKYDSFSFESIEDLKPYIIDYLNK